VAACYGDAIIDMAATVNWCLGDEKTGGALSAIKPLQRVKSPYRKKKKKKKKKKNGQKHQQV